MERVREAYQSFINRVPFYGVAVLGIDSLDVRGLLPSARKPVVTYGVAADADLRAENITIEGFSTRFDVSHKGAASRDRHDPFAGASRGAQWARRYRRRAGARDRFRGRCQRARVVPGHLSALRGEGRGRRPDRARRLCPSSGRRFARRWRPRAPRSRKRIVAVFQPHRFTRLRDLFDDFVAAFDDADLLYLMEVYPAGEEPIAGVSARRLYEALRARGHLEVRYLGDESKPAARIADATVAGDLIVTLGAGDIYKIGEEILTVLAASDDRERRGENP